MSQSLYDAQHGMSPEELWSRYRQYPWSNNAGEMVMQGEPNYWQGPGLPDGVQAKTLPTGMYGATLRNALNKGDKKPLATLVSSLLTPSDQVFSANHELTHGRQLAEGMPDGPDLANKVTPMEYANHPGEMQARMNSGMSLLPEEYRKFTHPFNYSSIETGMPPRLNRIIEAGMAKLMPQSDIEANRADENMLANEKAKKAMPKLSLMELLMQGREQYVPPFISQGMQK
jgi:hypothetical protein